MAYSTIVSEGDLLPLDLIEAVAKQELPGQRPQDFKLNQTLSVTDYTALLWQNACTWWRSFQTRLDDSKRSGESVTTITRRFWVEKLLQSLDYDIEYQGRDHIINGRRFPISHRADSHLESPPIHIEGYGVDLDGRSKLARHAHGTPHAIMQEYLNSSEHVWGILTNGERLRLLRDSSRFSRPTYLEFNLRSMFEEEKFSEFILLFRHLHRSRLPKSIEDAQDCWLEHYHRHAIEQGGRVRENLRQGVEQALIELGNGLLGHPHPNNELLREKLATQRLTPQGFYRQLLKLIYRLLFLMVAEERNAIVAQTFDREASDFEQKRLAYQFPPAGERLKIYYEYYSLQRLRFLAGRPGIARDSYQDLWQGLLNSFEQFKVGIDLSHSLALAPLNGELFNDEAIRDLAGIQLYNRHLLNAIRALSHYYDAKSESQRRVNYAALDVEELGSVYESLLDYRPLVELDAPRDKRFRLVYGTDRKSTGSYYTSPELVKELIRSALDPLIAERLAPNGSALSFAEQEQALLNLRVLDPACGSGHLLLAAARRIGHELAKIRNAGDLPTPELYRHAVRDVIQKCIFGVDINPLSVDLCKLSLWIEGHAKGLPLDFLDAHIKRGNSLVGTWAEQLEKGIPDEAYKPLTGDDKAIAASLRKQNKQARERWQKHGEIQLGIDYDAPSSDQSALSQAFLEFEQIDTSVAAGVFAKSQAYSKLRKGLSSELNRYNLWAAAFFQRFSQSNLAHIPISSDLHTDRQDRSLEQKLLFADMLADQLGFFHWELEFPQIFKRDSEDKTGFDLILANPPWERIKLQEQEHFVDVAEISQASNKAERERIIAAWRIGTPQQRARIEEFERAKQLAESESQFVRTSQLFPLSAVGDVNTYALFTELVRTLLAPHGRAGIIVPTGIATDDSTKALFTDLSQQKQLLSLYDFENREKIFPAVDSRFKFSLLSLGQNVEQTQFSFFITKPEQLHHSERRFSLSPDEIALINPNTRTAPIFRSKADAELSKKIYRRVPILLREAAGSQPEQNPWGIRFMTMFHMSNDSHLFLDRPHADSLPLYEAKMIHQYTHRWASYKGQAVADLSLAELANPTTRVNPRYWLAKEQIERRLEERGWDKQWLLAFRDITNATNERTAIFSLLPLSAVGNSAPIILFDHVALSKIAAFIACVSSLAFDAIARPKVGGTHLNFFIVKQLPVLPPEAFDPSDLMFIVPRVLELVYTAYDLQGFAQDLWDEADLFMREALIAQRLENARASADQSSEQIKHDLAALVPQQTHTLPPFIWQSERRAQLRAELDAYIAYLYGLSRDDLRYILDPHDLYGPSYPSETFRVLKEKEQRLYGEYRTRRLVLEAWDRLFEANEAKLLAKARF
jgi:SAM-dependent methyltransferase